MFAVHDPPPAIVLAGVEHVIQKSILYMLDMHGYRVFCAATGDDVLAEIGERAIDAVLMDSAMPGKSAFDTCREIKSHPDSRVISVLLYVAPGDDRARIEGTACGADDFVSPPLRKQELLARMRSMVRLKRSAAELEIVRSQFGFATIEV